MPLKVVRFKAEEDAIATGSVTGGASTAEFNVAISNLQLSRAAEVEHKRATEEIALESSIVGFFSFAFNH